MRKLQRGDQIRLKVPTLSGYMGTAYVLQQDGDGSGDDLVAWTKRKGDEKRAHYVGPGMSLRSEVCKVRAKP